MRVLIMAKEGNQSEAATPPTPEAMAEYQKFDQELLKAGVVLEAGRLHPSSQGKRVRFDGKKRTVIDGPVRGDQGARGRVLAMAGALDRRGPRVAQEGTLRRRDLRDP